VDEEPAITKALRRILRGHKVEAADSGLEALAICQERSFDLMLYDLTMPDLSGPDMYRRLQEAGSRIRVVFTSAGAISQDVGKFLSETSVVCLDKPFDPIEIHGLLRA
jgi:CheY-like chemotaxis protein